MTVIVLESALDFINIILADAAWVFQRIISHTCVTTCVYKANKPQILLLGSCHIARLSPKHCVSAGAKQMDARVNIVG